MIGQLKKEVVQLEFGEKLQLQLEFNPIDGQLEVMLYHDDHFDERLVTVANDDGSRRFSITGASDKFKDKLYQELEFDGACDTGNGKRDSLVSVYYTGDERSLSGSFFR